MHDQLIMHRDLKPENIFMNKIENKIFAKLGDFGLSRQMDSRNQLASTYAGSPIYMAPELIAQKKYDNKVDVWSLGCIIYELCALRPAFDGRTIMQVMSNIEKKTVPSVSPPYSIKLQTLLSQMLEKDPARRITVDMCIKSPCYAMYLSQEGKSHIMLRIIFI